MRLKNLKQIRERSAKTQQQVADELKIPIHTYRGWEQLKSSPRSTELYLLADYFKCTADDLFGRKDTFEHAFTGWRHDKIFSEVPLYEAITAGTPIETVEQDSWYLIPKQKADEHPNAFLLRVDGNSMDKKLPNGSYALVDPDQKDVLDNKAYALCINGHDATIRRIHPLNNGYEICPDSHDPTFEKTLLNYNEPDTPEIRIIGRVVWATLPLDFDI